MAEAVYFLCFLTSLSCMLLLLRAYRKNRSPLLFWSMVCFLGLALNNAGLICDLILFPEVDFSMARLLPGFMGLTALIAGLTKGLT